MAQIKREAEPIKGNYKAFRQDSSREDPEEAQMHSEAAIDTPIMKITEDMVLGMVDEE